MYEASSFIVCWILTPLARRVISRIRRLNRASSVMGESAAIGPPSDRTPARVPVTCVECSFFRASLSCSLNDLRDSGGRLSP
jgi:hypothetical protein